jgi:hypothetical protein
VALGVAVAAVVVLMFAAAVAVAVARVSMIRSVTAINMLQLVAVQVTHDFLLDI